MPNNKLLLYFLNEVYKFYVNKNINYYTNNNDKCVLSIICMHVFALMCFIIEFYFVLYNYNYSYYN